jgi:hypothetical protein
MAMSIVFKPKIPKDFSAHIPARKKAVLTKESELKRAPHRAWSELDKERLIGLRAVGVSYHDCALLLNRGQSGCVTIMSVYEMHSVIAEKRRLIIAEVMK